MLVTFLVLSCCIFLYIRFRTGDPFYQKIYWIGLPVKIAGAFALGYVYTQWKPEGDILAFFNSAKDLYHLALETPSDYLSFLYKRQFPHYEADSRNGFFVKILSVILLVSNGNFWIAGVYFALVSFASCWFLIRSLSMDRISFFVAAASFLLVPSVVVWTSGITKETVLCAALFYLIAIGIRYQKGTPISFPQVMLTILTLFVLVKLRYFLFGLVILGYLTLILVQLRKIPIPGFLKITGLTLIGALAIYFVSKLNYNLNFNHLPQSVFDNYQQIFSASTPGNAMSFNLDPSWSCLLVHIPLGLFSGLFRPLPGEGPIFYLFAQAESTLLIMGVLWSLWLILGKKQEVKLSILLACAAAFILVLAPLTALTSPNFGTLIRYRAAYYPLFFYLVWLLPFTHIFSKKPE